MATLLPRVVSLVRDEHAIPPGVGGNSRRTRKQEESSAEARRGAGVARAKLLMRPRPHVTDPRARAPRGVSKTKAEAAPLSALNR